MTLEEWLETYPQSPLSVLAGLLQEYQQGGREAEDMLSALQVFDEFLQEWAEAVMEEDQDPTITGDLLDSLQGLADAAGIVREYVESGEEELAEEALALAIQAQEGLLDVMELTFE